jgi:tetratricopeptide (TPR) repeat protein
MTHVARRTQPTELSHSDAGAFYVQGLLHLRDGHFAEAERLLALAVAHDGRHEGARRNLVRTLLATGRFTDVIVQAGLALAISPEEAELHYALGTALNAIGRPAEAALSLSHALTIDPKHAPSWLNLGNACADLDDVATAEQCCRMALSFDPGLPEAHSSLGFLLTVQGRLAEAIAACEAAVALRPGFVHAHWNLATAALLSGDLPRGFRDYEWRKRHDIFRRDFVDLPGPVWDGGDPAGMTILVQAEQGFGDAIQFARFLIPIVQRGGRPILVCDPRVAPLLAQMPGVAVVAKGDPLPPYDAWVDQMSLPRAFACDLNSIPCSGDI